MKKSRTFKKERNENLKKIREYLFRTIKKNRNFNLRSLSRSLNKNDAYLQQYIQRGSPNYLPEEERLRLSIMLKINYDDLTPNWILNSSLILEKTINVKDKTSSSESLLNFPKKFFQKIKFTKEQNLLLYQFPIKLSFQPHDAHIITIVDIGVKKFQDNNDYLLDDNNNLFLAKIYNVQNYETSNSKKLFVRPFENKFGAFRINENKIKIFGKIIFKSKNIYEPKIIPNQITS